MNEGREAKRLVFARVSALLRHVILQMARNGHIDIAMSDTQAREVNKLPAVDMLAVQTALAALEMTAEDPEIIAVFLNIVSPVGSFNPGLLHDQFVALTRAELGLPALPRNERSIPINLECNLIKIKPGTLPK